VGKRTFAIALLSILAAILLAVVTAGGDRDSIAGHIPGSRPPLPTTGLVPDGNNLSVLEGVMHLSECSVPLGQGYQNTSQSLPE